jgi:hypothetical protein
MKFPRAVFLVHLLLVTGCTSVKVNRLTQEKLPKVPAKQVQQVSAEVARQRPSVMLATIDLSTGSPFAADLHALVRQRTGKLGGNAYVVTSGNSQTTLTGGFGSLFGDKTSASMNVEALRWKDQPAPQATPPAKPRKASAWWRPWSWF